MHVSESLPHSGTRTARRARRGAGSRRPRILCRGPRPLGCYPAHCQCHCSLPQAISPLRLCPATSRFRKPPLLALSVALWHEVAAHVSPLAPVASTCHFFFLLADASPPSMGRLLPALGGAAPLPFLRLASAASSASCSWISFSMHCASRSTRRASSCAVRVLRNQSKRKSHDWRTSLRSSSQRPKPSWLVMHTRKRSISSE
mmetsp:Transcript_15264/g.41113  ORF Transcript_15264/g.41113 Transcript_15264/m.41113 type:complete len:202 (-) Transcript_15264:2207-2812(-)